MKFPYCKLTIFLLLCALAYVLSALAWAVVAIWIETMNESKYLDELNRKAEMERNLQLIEDAKMKEEFIKS